MLAYNFENSSSPYRNGNNLHFDRSALLFLSKHQQVGLISYFYDPIIDICKSGVLLGELKSRIGGIGSQVAYQFKIDKQKHYLILRGYKEFDTKNPSEGWNASVALTMPILIRTIYNAVH